MSFMVDLAFYDVNVMEPVSNLSHDCHTKWRGEGEKSRVCNGGMFQQQSRWFGFRAPREMR